MALESFDFITDVDEVSTRTPALALLSDQRTLALAWTEHNGPNRIILKVCTDISNLPLRFGAPFYMESDLSRMGPAIAAGRNKKLYVAYRGPGHDAQLYLGSLVYVGGTFDWDFGDPVRPLGEYSYYAPALSANWDTDRVALAWTGTDTLSLVNTKLYTNVGFNFTASSKVVFPENSVDSPGVAFIDIPGFGFAVVYLMWTGTDAQHRLNSILEVTSPIHLSPKEILNEVSPYGPTLTNRGQEIYLAWTGDDVPRHVNVYQNVSGPNPTFGMGRKFIFDQASIAAPSVCPLPMGNSFAVAWVDPNSKVKVGVKFA